MKEIWKAVVGHPGYEVSDRGRVRSPFRGGRVLRSANASAYPRVEIHGRSCNVHKLVAEAFIGPRREGMQVRHLNGNKDDARLRNLRYGTPQENNADAEAHGTRVRGTRHPLARLTDRQVRSMRALWPRVSQPWLAAKYGVDQATVWRVLHRKTWAHV